MLVESRIIYLAMLTHAQLALLLLAVAVMAAPSGDRMLKLPVMPKAQLRDFQPTTTPASILATYPPAMPIDLCITSSSNRSRELAIVIQ